MVETCQKLETFQKLARDLFDTSERLVRDMLLETAWMIVRKFVKTFQILDSILLKSYQRATGHLKVNDLN